MVDNVQGDKLIAQKFKDIYQGLYNSIDDPQFAYVVRNLNEDIHNKCIAGECDECCHNINVNLVNNTKS